jgi:acetoin utilization protein AcuB
MFVRDVMTKNPVTITEKMTVFEALELMKKEKIRRLPVMRDKKVIGIVTELDLLRVSPSTATSLSVFELHYLLSKMVVKDVMTKDVTTVTPDSTIEQAAIIMRDNEISGLPVVDGTSLVGIITETNLFDALLEHF